VRRVLHCSRQNGIYALRSFGRSVGLEVRGRRAERSRNDGTIVTEDEDWKIVTSSFGKPGRQENGQTVHWAGTGTTAYACMCVCVCNIYIIRTAECVTSNTTFFYLTMGLSCIGASTVRGVLEVEAWPVWRTGLIDILTGWNLGLTR
jgi:hypothetical protein